MRNISSYSAATPWTDLEYLRRYWITEGKLKRKAVCLYTVQVYCRKETILYMELSLTHSTCKWYTGRNVRLQLEWPVMRLVGSVTLSFTVTTIIGVNDRWTCSVFVAGVYYLVLYGKWVIIKSSWLCNSIYNYVSNIIVIIRIHLHWNNY